MPKFIPALYITPMVQAILEDKKTKTRRLNKLTNINPKATEIIRTDNWPKQGDWLARFKFQELPEAYEVTDIIRCPYGKPGDILWVREQMYQVWEDGVYYKADHAEWQTAPDDYYYGNCACSIPNLHMPKIACRLFLEITDIRVERLNDITDAEALAEGIQSFTKDGELCKYGLEGWTWSYTNVVKGKPTMDSKPWRAFAKLWTEINGFESWNSNPWVWVLSFKRIEKPENFC